MSVFSKIKGFFGRHRNKFIVGGVLFAGSVLFTRYAQQRIKEWQEKEASEFLERARKQQHFESITRTCNHTIHNLSLALNDELMKVVNTEEMIEKLQENPENRLALWNELKVLVFTRVGTMIYSCVILVITLRIQLSIIGGYLYKDPNSISTEMQERYLSLCQSLLTSGVTKLANLIEQEYRKILKPVDLKKQMKLYDMETLFWAMQTAVATHSENPVEKLRQFILTEEVPASNGIYSSIVRDTADLLDSEEVKILTTHCISRSFILLSNILSDFYVGNDTKIMEVSSNDVEQFQNPFELKKPLAKLLPVINGLFTRKSLLDRLIQTLVTNDKIQALGANVYECLL